MHIPPPLEILKRLPLSTQAADFMEKSWDQARQIALGLDPRKVLVVGPCSIHNREEALEYARRFKELELAVRDAIFLVMRVYVEKPRTTTGWKGLLYDPHLDGSDDMVAGLHLTRELLLALAEREVAAATEFVDPLAALYFQDLITWGFIGARTSASQPHRQFASSMAFPMGFKNSVDGNIDYAVQGVMAAKAPHTFLHISPSGQLEAVRSGGNPYAHVVLRGSSTRANFDARSVAKAMEKLQREHLPVRLMVDCSHGNCQKHFERQHEVFDVVLRQMHEGNQALFGMMLESHLESGNQPISSELQYGVSITDPCIDWNKTVELIEMAYGVLSEGTTAAFSGSSSNVISFTHS